MRVSAIHDRKVNSRRSQFIHPRKAYAFLRPTSSVSLRDPPSPQGEGFWVREAQFMPQAIHAPPGAIHVRKDNSCGSAAIHAAGNSCAVRRNSRRSQFIHPRKAYAFLRPTSSVSLRDPPSPQGEGFWVREAQFLPQAIHAPQPQFIHLIRRLRRHLLLKEKAYAEASL